MGSAPIAAAIEADLLDEFTIHQVPILLGHGVRFFASLPERVHLQRMSVVEAPGVTHLRYSIVR
ncbi:hypothetical protein GE115_10990 [Agromyces sp. CFH 90414]|uniref:Bacterial bifunctional deaminase-reductase C-terminal domain-containing protein n=1 Tax=Agromyces agglutinans TaxID=2662258 RepID=A0A6I2F4I4_9MICO|nr:dihydrofolate reductase family protein [Agromyces agglutinans]MRG60385.1 hypothetical protein [Agromyces agglutinans]